MTFSTLTGAFTPGRKIQVGLNFGNGLGPGVVFGQPANVPKPPGRQVALLGTVTAAADGSATLAFTVPALRSLPPNPKGGPFGYDLVFTDVTHPKTRVVNLAGIQPFASPAPARQPSTRR